MLKEGALHLTPGKPRKLAFGDDVRKDLKLLEVDEVLLQELLQTGLTIKGEEGEDAVLCSQSKTYAVKTVETTNSVWLVQPDQGVDAAVGSSQHQEPQCTPPGQHLGLATQLQRNEAAAVRVPVVVTAIASSHMELITTAPRLHKLDQLLQEHAYGRDSEGDVMEVDGEGAGPNGSNTRERLLDRVQASRAELDEALRERHALCLDGHYCSVDPEYLGTLLEVLLLTSEEHGWAWDHAIPAQQAAKALQANGYDPRVTHHCLEMYGTREGSGGGSKPVSQSAGDSSSGDLWRLDEVAVCRHFARKLLGERAEWDVGEFLKAWMGSLPESMHPSLEMLGGEALVNGQRIKRFAVTTLPADAEMRFAALFKERERWLWDDLEPYMVGLQGPGQTVEGLLLKYSRASQPRPTDPVMYSAR